MTALLTSVRDAEEAGLALAAGSDWIDLKEPRDGALGRVAPAIARAVVELVGGRVPVSATIGDCWEAPDCFAARVAGMAAAGVSHVKIGLYARGLAAPDLAALTRATGLGCPLIAVCFAEAPPTARDIATLAAVGLRGVMLDTARKKSHALRALMSDADLGAFVAAARGHGLLTGLAGRLSLSDVPPLLALEPDYLGFRSALCAGQAREGVLTAEAVAAVKAGIAAYHPPAIASAADLAYRRISSSEARSDGRA